MSKTRTTSKPQPKDEAPVLPPDLVASMLSGDGGPAAEVFAQAERAPAQRRDSHQRAAERAALVSDILTELEAEEADLGLTPQVRRRQRRRRKAWSRVSFNLPDDLMHEVRNAARHLSGPPELLNLSRMTENALRRELRRLRRAHRSGREFPDRSGADD